MSEKLDKLAGILAGRMTEIANANKAAADAAREAEEQRREEVKKQLMDDPEYRAWAEAKERQSKSNVNLTNMFTGEKYKAVGMYNKELARQGVIIKDARVREVTNEYLLDLTGMVMGDPKSYEQMRTWQQKTMSEGTPADGGYLVPTEVSDFIITLARDGSVAMRDARRITMSRDKMEFPRELTGLTFQKIAENSTISGSNPTLDQVALDTDLYGLITSASIQLVSDSAYDLTSHILGLAGNALASTVDTAVFYGTDFASSVFGSASNTVTCASGVGTAVSYDNILEAEADLKASYLSGAKFYLHRSELRYVKKVKDDLGAYILVNSMTGQTGINGYPYELVEALTASASISADTAFMAFGNLQNYYLGLRQGMTVDTSKEAGDFWSKHQVGWKFVTRMDGAVAIPAAFVVFKTHA